MNAYQAAGLRLLPLLVVGCGPSVDDLDGWARDGAVDRVAQALAADAPRGLEGAAAVAGRHRRLTDRRAEIHGLETQILLERAFAALDRGDVRAAVSAWAVGARDPDGPEIAPLRERVVAALAQASPEVAADGWEALAELGGPEEAARRERAARSTVASRWADPSVARAASAGVTVESARDVLETVDPILLDAPDWVKLGAAGDLALVRLAETPAAVAALPGLADPPAFRGAGLADALAHLDALAVEAAARGLPVDVWIAAWVEGALQAQDAWTRPVWPAELDEWQDFHDGVVVGVGLRVSLAEDGGVVVDRPELGGPLWASGVHQGDRIVQLSTDEATLVPVLEHRDHRIEAVEAFLTGPIGTVVRIDLRTPDGTVGVVAAERLPVARETVHGFTRGADNSWSPWLDEGAGLAYVRFSAFRAHSEPRFDELVAPLEGRVRGIVVDLRGNPGGDVDAAVQIADRFVAGGDLVRIDGRRLPDLGPLVDPLTGEALVPWNQAIEGGPLEGVPTVVLVDAETASAAEVLAGALQQGADATVVGAPTWGKGLSQVLQIDDDNRWAFQATNLVWSLPDGRRLVRGSGIVPDVPIAASPAEQHQIRGMIERREALRVHADGSPFQPLPPPDAGRLPILDDDPVLTAAELVLRVRVAASH